MTDIVDKMTTIKMSMAELKKHMDAARQEGRKAGLLEAGRLAREAWCHWEILARDQEFWPARSAYRNQAKGAEYISDAIRKAGEA